MPSPKPPCSTGKKSRGKRKIFSRQQNTIIPPKTQHEIAAEKVEHELKSACIEKLSHSGEPVGIIECHSLIKESYELLEKMLAELILNPPLACKHGCTYCCINQVSFTEPEALYLGFYLLETRTTEELKKLEARTDSLLDKMKGKSRQEIGMNRHMYPCLFLENGTCSIYPARPLVCRGWNSVDSDMCKNSNQTANALAPIENHELPRMLAEGIQRGILSGTQELKLESGFIMVPRAVKIMLHEQLSENIIKYSKNWLEGKPFFATPIPK